MFPSLLQTLSSYTQLLLVNCSSFTSSKCAELNEYIVSIVLRARVAIICPRMFTIQFVIKSVLLCPQDTE